MKRLRVLLVCLIVALLCWYPSQYVYCSEQSLSDPGQSAGDKSPDGQKQEQEQDSMQHKVLEGRATHTSYDMGLETERVAREKLATHNVHQEQTVNPREDEVKETKPDPESDTVPVAPEPEPHPDPLADLDLQTADTQDHDQEVPASSTPEPVPAQGQVSTDAPGPAEVFSDAPAAHPSLDSNPATSPDEAENVPTSKSAGLTHTG